MISKHKTKGKFGYGNYVVGVGLIKCVSPHIDQCLLFSGFCSIMLFLVPVDGWVVVVVVGGSQHYFVLPIVLVVFVVGVVVVVWL